MRKSGPHKQAGFTLIEMIVSLGLFAVVVTIAVGSLLVLISANRQLQSEQNILGNISFALDTMTRELRTGTYYYCAASGSVPNVFSSSYDLDNLDTGSPATRDCFSGRPVGATSQGVAFVEGGDSITGLGRDRILYYFDSSVSSRGLYRRVGARAPELLLAGDLDIRDVEFFVSGSDTLGVGADTVQPAVTIIVTAADSTDATDKLYTLQATVTQRTIDL